MNSKILIVELWGLGDLTFSTPFIREASRNQDDVHLLAKLYARQLLHPSYPRITFHPWDAPWTRFRGKYRLWTWDWKELFRVISKLRAEKFDVAVSVRNDPRDHLLMWLIGARKRYGFAVKGSGIFLSRAIRRTKRLQHRAEDWHDLGLTVGLTNIPGEEPSLRHEGYRSYRIEQLLGTIRKPIVCLHTGAKSPLRRWPEEYFVPIVAHLRKLYDFHLMLVPDPDGYGSGLASSADSIIRNLEVRELVSLLGSSQLVICNDSGPGHIAAECKCPVIAIFGPGEPAWFRPWGENNLVVIRDICPYRPCFDYCHFPEPYCLTKLMPEEVWPDIHAHIKSLIGKGVLPRELDRKDTVPRN